MAAAYEPRPPPGSSCSHNQQCSAVAMPRNERKPGEVRRGRVDTYSSANLTWFCPPWAESSLEADSAEEISIISADAILGGIAVLDWFTLFNDVDCI